MYSSKKLTIIFLNILKIKNSNIKNTEFQKTKNWDSLKNIQLFLEIEKTFKIKINTSDWYKLTSFKKIDNYLKKKSK